tara:strand:- start:9492 stop:9665 length:174 start_codon:yes stop_codon:yes gene_type:complete
MNKITFEGTESDIKNTVIFLRRCNLNGEESTTHALLLQKYVDLLTPKPVKAEAKKEK